MQEEKKERFKKIREGLRNDILVYRTGKGNGHQALLCSALNQRHLLILSLTHLT